MDVLGTLQKLAAESGFAAFFMAGGWKNFVMIVIAFVLLYLGIVKKFEPLLLVGIAFALLQQKFGSVKMPGGYLISAYPVVLKWTDVLLTCAGVSVVGYLIALIPSSRH